MSELEELIRTGQEGRNLEFKESQPWDTLKRAITRTAMAMANTRDGGRIVIGISERTRGDYGRVGTMEEHETTYTRDDVQAFVNSFAEPHVVLRVDRVEVDGRRYVVITVDEFADYPVLCVSDGPDLRQGALYVRPGRIAETSEVRYAEDMRVLIDLAAEKKLRSLLTTVERAGGRVVATETADDLFTQEIPESLR